MQEIGYSQDQILQINSTASSNKVRDIIKSNSQIVTEQIKTVKIPTILFNGKRYSGAIDLPVD